jgi:UDP-glucose 4-epimerase
LQAADLAGVKKFIFSSTGGAIYGEQEYFPADETHITRPECPYGLSKRSAELYIEYFSRKNGMPSFSLRFGNVYGPRQNPHGEAGVVSIFVEQIFESKPLTVNGDGNQTRDFIFVQDIVNAIKLILNENSNSGNTIYQVFNLGTGVESSVRDIINSLSDICKNETPKMSFDISYRPQPEGEQMRSLLDASLFSKNYDWSPKINLKDGLAQTFLEAKKLLT